ncbi:transposase [Streptomyces sp. NPDC000075]
MLTQLEGHRLPEWIEAASTADLPALQSFARHLERDLDAVVAGLSQPWNSGVVEGHVSRIKMLNVRCSAERDSSCYGSAPAAGHPTVG